MSEANGPGVFVPPPLIFAVAMAAGVLIDGDALAWRHAGRPAQVAGAALAVAGLVLIGGALGLFRRARTRPEPWRPASVLIASGLYRFTRNPMYLGMTLVSAGIAIFFESIAAAILLAVVVPIIDRFVIAREEAYLLRTFGQPYAAYRKTVRRWF